MTKNNTTRERCFLATPAFGCGVGCPEASDGNCTLPVNWMPRDDTDDYWRYVYMRIIFKKANGCKTCKDESPTNCDTCNNNVPMRFTGN